MVKNIKFGKNKKSDLTRELIADLGNTIYMYKEVTSINISVNFKDGSSIEFDRDEIEDRLRSRLETSEDFDDEREFQ